MNRQQKIKHLQEQGFKVVFQMNGGGVLFLTKGLQSERFNSVNEAHRRKFGY